MPTFSYFSSPFTTVKDALKTRNCTLITDAVVSHVDMDMASNKARGVTFVDRTTKETKQIRGKAVILCAQALESTRILLNSSTREYPKGLANSSGMLGHYLMDHVVGGGASGTFADLGYSSIGERAAPSERGLPGAFPQHADQRESIRILFAGMDFRADRTRSSTWTLRALARNTRRR